MPSEAELNAVLDAKGPEAEDLLRYHKGRDRRRASDRAKGLGVVGVPMGIFGAEVPAASANKAAAAAKLNVEAAKEAAYIPRISDAEDAFNKFNEAAEKYRAISKAQPLGIGIPAAGNAGAVESTAAGAVGAGTTRGADPRQLEFLEELGNRIAAVGHERTSMSKAGHWADVAKSGVTNAGKTLGVLSELATVGGIPLLAIEEIAASGDFDNQLRWIAFEGNGRPINPEDLGPRAKERLREDPAMATALFQEGVVSTPLLEEVLSPAGGEIAQAPQPVSPEMHAQIKGMRGN